MLRGTCICWLLLSSLSLIFTLDEREYDPQVAPAKIVYSPAINLWRSLAKQVRLVIRSWQPTVRTNTKRPRVQLSSTTPKSEPELQYYGALNPIYQKNEFIS